MIFNEDSLLCHKILIANSLEKAFPNRCWVILSEIDIDRQRAGYYIGTPYTSGEGCELMIAERRVVLFKDLPELESKINPRTIVEVFQKALDNLGGKTLSRVNSAWITNAKEGRCPVRVIF